MPKMIDAKHIRHHVLSRLYWFGEFSPKEIKSAFGVGSDFASRFIGELRKEIDLQPVGKRYALGPLTPASKLIEMGVSSAEFLSEILLASHSDQQSSSEASGPYGNHVPAWSMLKFRRSVRPEVLRGLVQALTQKKAIEIVYVGMAVGDVLTRRTVEPIKLVYVSDRWHLDAYCYLKKGRRDFLLARIFEANKLQHARYGMAVSQESGVEEQNKRTFWFKPHPALTADQVRALAFEFGLDDDGVLKMHETDDRVFYFRNQFVTKEGSNEKPPEKLFIEISEFPVN